MDGDEDGSPSNWSSTRRAVVYRELRGVLDAQQSAMHDIVDTALRTVRITAVLLGIVVSAAGLAAVTFHPVIASLGVASLIASAVAGVFTYSESNLILGPTGEYALSVAIGEVDTEWELDLLAELASWTEQNAADIDYNGRLLFYTQVLFVIGIVLLAASVAFYPARAYLGL